MMESLRKRKLSNATPTSAEGSVSKKLRLLVRSLSFDGLVWYLLACQALFEVERWRARRMREVARLGEVEWEGEGGAFATLKVSSMDGHRLHPKPALPSFAA
jgi:hypothetical protein